MRMIVVENPQKRYAKFGICLGKLEYKTVVFKTASVILF